LAKNRPKSGVVLKDTTTNHNVNINAQTLKQKNNEVERPNIAYGCAVPNYSKTRPQSANFAKTNTAYTTKNEQLDLPNCTYK
jgi:hypothetical protein